MAMAVTIGCHLGLLMVLLQPATHHADIPAVVENDAATLKVQFISLPRSTPAPQAAPAPRSVLTVPGKASVKEVASPPSQRVAHAATQSSAANTAEVAPQSVTPATTDQYANNQVATGDGGFQERLLNAQHAQDIRGVPGSDRPVVPDVELIDPRDQGVGAVMRGTQRLFGITNRHCIDVGVWENLTLDELKARRLSPADVKRAAEKYNCNRPLGLSF
jgi:hypothetical protein